MSNPVPVGWTATRLSLLADIRSSNVDKKSNNDEVAVRLCNYMDVYSNNQITNRIKFMVATAKQNQIDRFSLHQGDVIITKDSETPDDIAIPSYVSEPMDNVLCGYHLALIRPNKEKVNGEFLSHLFGLAQIRHHFYVAANGITRYGLNIDAIENAPIQIPPLPEQQKIASILTAVDDVIESTQAQINKLKDLKTGMMQELLTKGIGHAEFKDSLVGRIPKAWEVRTLDSIIEKIVDCEHKTAPYVDKSDFMVVRTNNVKNGQLIIDDMKFTTEDSYNEWTSRLVPEGGDVLFTREAPAGESCLVPSNIKVCMGQRMVLLRPNKSLVDAVYFSIYLNSQTAIDAIFQRTIGTTVSRINIEDIRKIPCVVPSLKEQKLIANSVKSIQDSILAIENKLQTFLSAKKALMQDLLTGTVRVQVNN